MHRKIRGINRQEEKDRYTLIEQSVGVRFTDRSIRVYQFYAYMQAVSMISRSLKGLCHVYLSDIIVINTITTILYSYCGVN